MTTNCTLSFECGSPLPMNYSGTVDIYSVDHHGYKTCDATQGKILASLKCGEHHANKAIRALDFIRKDVETYYFIGFARMNTKPEKPVLVGGTCKSHKSKLKIHICALVRKSHGKVCTMKSLPKVLASKQTNQKDKEEKPKGSLKTFYISMIIVGILGVLIALAMCIFQPLKSQQVSGRRNVSNRKSNKDTAFQRLHDKYRVEDMEEGNK
ncbi:unnamed protein product [Porites lobata]|uniref:Uncharacterized protein n=1 Tax=Porites lobata TaxID=104759 RepID=A0ABN8QUS3_9CNID|nr:unnamed protein product [Porites lobata]